MITPHCTIHYANKELAEQAWQGIIKKICHLLPSLKDSSSSIGTADERNRRKLEIIKGKRSIIEFCLHESSKLMALERFSLAIPAAIHALKYAKELDGDKSVTVVEPNLHLGQAFLGLKEYNKALENLSLARWIVLNSPDCTNTTRSRLFMLFGRVLAAQGNFIQAKDEYSNSIYYASRNGGPETVPTSVGYFRLGDIFLAEGNVESALAFFDKVVDIWYKYLTAIHQSLGNTNELRPLRDETVTMSPAATTQELSEEYITDGYNELQQILDHRRRILGTRHIAVGEVQFTLGLFGFFIISDLETSKGYIGEALEIYEQQLGETSVSTTQVCNFLKLVNEAIDHRTAVEELKHQIKSDLE